MVGKNITSVRLKGINSRLDELQAAILRVKLQYLDQWNLRRRQLANLYYELLSDTELVLPFQPEHSKHVFHQFVIRHSKRNDLRNYLKVQNIHTLVHYPIPVHLQPAYLNLGYSAGSFPNTELASLEVLSLPLYPELTEEKVRLVCQAVRSFFHRSQHT